MKIRNTSNQKTSSTADAKASAKAGQANSTKQAKSAGSSQGRSAQAVSVSGRGSLIENTMSGDSSIRSAKVEAIRLEVESGNYELDAQKTADKLIDSLTDYSLA